MYMMKLEHMAAKKFHTARSTGPYSRGWEQPTAGRSRDGGQRVGEMEAWALEASGAPAVLHEMLTVKSDDVDGRKRLWRVLTRGGKWPDPGTANPAGTEAASYSLLRAAGARSGTRRQKPSRVILGSASERKIAACRRVFETLFERAGGVV